MDAINYYFVVVELANLNPYIEKPDFNPGQKSIIVKFIR